MKTAIKNSRPLDHFRNIDQNFAVFHPFYSYVDEKVEKSDSV